MARTPKSDTAALPPGARWSTWEDATHSPGPRPEWLVTEPGALEQDLGVLKTGKEADVHLVRRWLPSDSSRECYLVAKRFRPSERRLFHRDAGYLEGRRVLKSRETRAMARRTEYGREVIAGRWSVAEFTALKELWALGLPVPYPVQHSGTEMLMEFIGHGRVAAPRLAAARVERADLPALFEQYRDLATALARRGWTHGDLSAYNVLLHDGRLVFIDWPQLVDVVGNPQGLNFLRRDVHTMLGWFAGKGYAVDEDLIVGDLTAVVTGT